MSDSDNTLWSEMESPDPHLMAEINRGELSASILSVPDEALDGWAIQVFPTVDENRIIIGVSSAWIESIVEDCEPEDIRDVIIEILEEATSIAVTYFEVNGK